VFCFETLSVIFNKKMMRPTMSKRIRAFILVFLASSCGSGYSSAPDRLDNACSIIRERPEYLKAFRATERHWGVPIHVQLATIYHESRFISNARPPYRYFLGIIPPGPQSSPSRYSQAPDGTWDDCQRRTGNRWARRDRMRHASDFMGWYMTKSRDLLNISLHDARNQYLAYHEGHTGFRRGSHNNKQWLLRKSHDVQSRADLYQRQLAGCIGEHFA